MKGDLHNTRNLRGATVVLMWCYCDATVVLQWCYWAARWSPKFLAKSQVGRQSTGAGAVERSCLPWAIRNTSLEQAASQLASVPPDIQS